MHGSYNLTLPLLLCSGLHHRSNVAQPVPMPVLPLLLPLILLLSLLQRAFSHEVHLLNSPLAHVALAETLPPGNTSHTVTLTCTATCDLHLHRDRFRAHTTFAVTADNFAHTAVFPDENPYTERLVLEKGVYELNVRSVNPSSGDVSGLLTYAFQHQLSACPLVLPTVLAPSPSPSRSPTPSPSASPSPEKPKRPARTPRASPEVAERQVTPRVVGGSIPDATLRTHMAAFVMGGAFVCSGSIISPRWALTAAHCSISSGARVSLGGASVTTGEFVSVQAAFPHPGFDFSINDSPFDIALILLDRPVPEDTVFIRVNTNASNPVPGAYARVAGYGETLRRSVATLRQVDIPVVSMPRCKSDYARANPIIARRLDERLQLCAGLREGGCDACQGDSGGPLAMFDAAGHLVQIGIVSFGIGCARAGFPGVHTRLSTFEPWMKEIGAGFIRSTNGETVFSTGSAEAASSGGFSIAGLSTLQTFLLIGGIALVAAVLVFLAAASLVNKARRRRARSDAPPPQSPPAAGEAQEYDAYGSGEFNPTTEQGLYPVYGPEHQYAGYAQQPPMQPPPVARNVQGGGAGAGFGGNVAGNLAKDDRGVVNSLYPQNTVLTH